MRMRVQKGESGQVLVLTALSLIVLLACVALAVDVGRLFFEKRNAQIAADAAAIAGAMNLEYVGSSAVTSAAQTAAANNGYASGEVTVIPSPTDGQHTGSGYVEVQINHTTQATFMAMFGFANVHVGARAVAGVTPSQACMYVLDPSDPSTLWLQGADTVNAPNCGIIVDSSNPDALCITGGASAVTAPYLDVAGGQPSQGKCGGTPSPVTVNTHSTPQPDPLQLSGPTPSQCGTTVNTTSDVTSSTALTSTALSDGTQLVCFAATSKGKAIATTLDGSASNLVLNPSTPTVYFFENGVTISGTVCVGTTCANPGVSNAGATIIVYQGQFAQGNAALSIIAPADKAYTYNGIALMMTSNDTTSTCQDPKTMTPCMQVQFGSGSGNLSGIIYAPKAQVYMQDNGGGVQAASIIAWQIYDKSSDLEITDNYSHANPSTTPLHKVTLVE